jgi:hypothetical protein
MTTDRPAKLTRVRDHSTDAVTDWLNGDTDVLDVQVVDEQVTWEADPPYPQKFLPPVGWIPIDEHIATPIFDGLDADCQPPRTPTGRVSRKPPRLPYTGGVAYQVFVDGSRDDHHSYFHGGRR